jgi:hypothetical protein
MNHGILLAAALLIGGQPASTTARGTEKGIVGTWRLVSATQRLADGTERPDPNVGAHARGYIIYTPTGQMCAMLENRDRARWAIGDRPTQLEAMAIHGNMVAYCGTYSG